jgi:hypothetical protein
VLPAELLIPSVDVLKGTLRVAVNHLLKGIPCHSCSVSAVPRFSKLCAVLYRQAHGRGSVKIGRISANNCLFKDDSCILCVTCRK